MAQLREEIAVQKAKETELNKTIHITGTSSNKLIVIINFTAKTMKVAKRTQMSLIYIYCRGDNESKTNVSNHVS